MNRPSVFIAALAFPFVVGAEVVTSCDLGGGPTARVEVIREAPIADSRFPKIVETTGRILRHVISMALAKHEHVVVLLAEGNHDISSSVWMRAMFKALCESEPRVEVIDSVMPYYVDQHGSTMIAWHH